MPLALLIGTLSLPFLIFLLQEYRDARGKRRNIAGRCYKCDGLMYPPIPMAHYHYRSPSSLFFYCAVCANSEDRKAGILLSIVGIAASMTFAANALKQSESSFWGAAFLGAAAVLIVVLIPFALLMARKTKALGAIEAGNFPAWESNPDLIAETKRLLAIENDPKTKAALQHVLDVTTNLERQANAAQARLQRGGSE